MNLLTHRDAQLYRLGTYWIEGAERNEVRKMEALASAHDVSRLDHEIAAALASAAGQAFRRVENQVLTYKPSDAEKLGSDTLSKIGTYSFARKPTLTEMGFKERLSYDVLDDSSEILHSFDGFSLISWDGGDSEPLFYSENYYLVKIPFNLYPETLLSPENPTEMMVSGVDFTVTPGLLLFRRDTKQLFPSRRMIIASGIAATESIYSYPWQTPYSLGGQQAGQYIRSVQSSVALERAAAEALGRVVLRQATEVVTSSRFGAGRVYACRSPVLPSSTVETVSTGTRMAWMTSGTVTPALSGEWTDTGTTQNGAAILAKGDYRQFKLADGRYCIAHVDDVGDTMPANCFISASYISTAGTPAPDPDVAGLDWYDSGTTYVELPIYYDETGAYALWFTGAPWMITPIAEVGVGSNCFMFPLIPDTSYDVGGTFSGQVTISAATQAVAGNYYGIGTFTGTLTLAYEAVPVISLRSVEVPQATCGVAEKGSFQLFVPYPHTTVADQTNLPEGYIFGPVLSVYTPNPRVDGMWHRQADWSTGLSLDALCPVKGLTVPDENITLMDSGGELAIGITGHIAQLAKYHTHLNATDNSVVYTETGLTTGGSVTVNGIDLFFRVTHLRTHGTIFEMKEGVSAAERAALTAWLKRMMPSNVIGVIK